MPEDSDHQDVRGEEDEFVGQAEPQVVLVRAGIRFVLQLKIHLPSQCMP